MHINKMEAPKCKQRFRSAFELGIKDEHSPPTSPELISNGVSHVINRSNLYPMHGTASLRVGGRSGATTSPLSPHHRIYMNCSPLTLHTQNQCTRADSVSIQRPGRRQSTVERTRAAETLSLVRTQSETLCWLPARLRQWLLRVEQWPPEVAT